MNIVSSLTVSLFERTSDITHSIEHRFNGLRGNVDQVVTSVMRQVESLRNSLSTEKPAVVVGENEVEPSRTIDQKTVFVGEAPAPIIRSLVSRLVGLSESARAYGSSAMHHAADTVLSRSVELWQIGTAPLDSAVVQRAIDSARQAAADLEAVVASARNNAVPEKIRAIGPVVRERVAGLGPVVVHRIEDVKTGVAHKLQDARITVRTKLGETEDKVCGTMDSAAVLVSGYLDAHPYIKYLVSSTHSRASEFYVVGPIYSSTVFKLRDMWATWHERSHKFSLTSASDFITPVPAPIVKSVPASSTGETSAFSTTYYHDDTADTDSTTSDKAPSEQGAHDDTDIHRNQEHSADHPAEQHHQKHHEEEDEQQQHSQQHSQQQQHQRGRGRKNKNKNHVQFQ